MNHAEVIMATGEIDRNCKTFLFLEVDADEWPGHQETGRCNVGVGNEIW